MRSSVDEFDAEDDEQIVERVAAIDVAKASAMVCTRVRHPSIEGRRVTRVWQVAATTNAILALADDLAELGVERIVVESTSDYWRPFVYLFEARGLTTWLVNARDVKQVPGRPKTDKIDAVWLAKLNERGMLRASFVPPVEIRQLRDYTRLRSDLTEERSRHKQRVEKLLEDALIKLSTVATDIFGVSGRAMIEALIAGERDPHVLAEMAKGRMRPKHPRLVEALTGRFDDHHADLARMLLDQIDALSINIEAITTRVDELIERIPAATAPTIDDTTTTTVVVGLRRCQRSSVSTRSPESGSSPPRSSSPRSAWTWPSSPPPTISCPGPNCHRAPSSPDPRAGQAKPAKATATSPQRRAR